MAVESQSIPACAGEPTGLYAAAITAQVYPRVCGGAQYEALGHDAVLGLSPRVRGSPIRRHIRQMLDRSIPACAGEPFRMPVASRSLTVYPRVCGEPRI